MSTTTLSPMPLEGSFSPEYHPDPLRLPPASVWNDRVRRKHAVIALFTTFITLMLMLFVGFHGYVAWSLAHPYVAPLLSNPKIAKGLDYRDISYPSASGRTTVNGWYIPAADHSTRTIVFSHGYGANREETWVPMYELADLLHGLHYNVLMFDYGYASSVKRTPATGGVEESEQLLASIAYAKAQGAKELIVWGFSMGAGTALQAALHTNDINAMILDSMFLTDSDTLYHNLTRVLPLPRFPSLPLIQWLMPLWTGLTVNDIPSGQIKKKDYHIPIFMMHGTNDALAPLKNAEAIAAKQTNPLSHTWIVTGGKHELLFQVHPKEYIERAVVFLSQVNRYDSRNAT